MKPRQAVLFLLDTQGAASVGAFNPGLALGTPHLDRLAAEGVRFTAAHCCSPVCGPARSAIFTGLYPHANGVLGNDMAPALDVPTLGQRLHQAGLHSAYIGKWHLDGTDYFGDGRCPPGWDPEYWMDGRNYLDSLPDQNARDLSRCVLDPAAVARHGVRAEFTHAWRIAERARAFIHAHREEDYLLVVSIDEPHHPHICPEPFASAFESFRFPVPNAASSFLEKPRVQREWAAHVAADHRTLFPDGPAGGLAYPRHFACNSFADSQVGRVLEALATDAPEALIIHTADHGDMFGAHGLLGKGPCVYDEIVRVPFTVRWPASAPAGGIDERPVSHIDIVPTLLDYFDLPCPPLLHGSSLLPRLRGISTPAPDATIFIEFNRFEVDHDGFGAFFPIRAAFDGRFKLALNLLDEDECYDRAHDPLELDNLVRRPPDRESTAARDRLHDSILEWMNRTRDPMRGPHWRRRPWRDLPANSWGGPTRPRPLDPSFLPATLLYDTGRPIERLVYDKH